MKKTILLVSLLVLSISSYSQVGINTQNPIGELHIDGLGNNSSGTPTALELSDDIIIKNDGNGGINVSLGGNVVNGASIALHSDKMAFLPNIVSLNSTLDITTINSPVEGMVVYNINKTENVDNNVIPGYYLYTASNIWERLMTEWYTGSVSNITLQNILTTSDVNQTLDFGNLTIFDSGSYAFSLNLSGTSPQVTSSYTLRRGSYFVSIYKKGTDDSSFVLVDDAEISIPLFTSGESFTYNTFLAGDLSSGDIVDIRIRNANGYPTATFLTTEYTGTTLSYWRIQ